MVGSGFGSLLPDALAVKTFGFTEDAGVVIMLLENSLSATSLSIVHFGRGKLKLTVATTTSCINSLGFARVHTVFKSNSNVDYVPYTDRIIRSG